MPDQRRLTEFEQKLTQLKQNLEHGNITIDEYVEQAQELQFEAEDKVWWLDAESETWYVAPIGTEDFQVYVSPAATQSPEPESIPPESELEAEFEVVLQLFPQL